MKRLFLTCLFKRMREPVSQTTHLRVLSAPISARSFSLPLALGMLSAVSLFASANGAPEERSSVERTGEERAATPRPSEASGSMNKADPFIADRARWDALYENEFLFAESGEPLLRMEIARISGPLELTIPPNFPLQLGPLGGVTLQRGRRSQWTITLAASTPGRERFWVIGDELAASEDTVIARQEAFWRDQGFEVRLFQAGSSRSAIGERPALDARRVIVALNPSETRAQAEAAATQLREGDGRQHQIISELLQRPRGRLTLEEKNGADRVEARELLWLDGRQGSVELRWRDERGKQSRTLSGEGYLTVGLDGRLTLVELMSAESLLELIVPAEIYTSSPRGALRAQAITARGILLMRAGIEHRSEPFHFRLVDFTRGRRPHSRTSEAVRRTRGQVLFDESGRLLNTVYHSTCGGHTEASHEIWGGSPQTSLSGVRDNALGDLHAVHEARVEAFLREPTPSFCESYRRVFRWEVRRSGAEVSSAIEERRAIGPIKEIEVQRRGVSGRAIQVAYHGSEGSLVLSGAALNRRVLGGLKSGLWIAERVGGEPEGEPEQWIFSGGGFGHGVGLCQHGAIGMARAGYGYQAILNHFYPESTRSALW